MLKALQIVINLTGHLILLAMIAFFGLNALLAMDVISSSYVQGAQFSDYEYLNTQNSLSEHDDFEHPRLAHKITHGAGAIIRHKRFSGEDPGAIDDETIHLFTIWLPELPEQYPATIIFSDSSQAKAMFSTGSHVWKKRNCSYYMTNGTLKLSKNWLFGLNIHIRGSLVPSGNHPVHAKLCTQKQFELNFSASETQLKQ